MTRGRGGRVKRERSTSAAPPPLSKRLRGPSFTGDPPPAASSAPSQVVVTGLPSDCSVLELKSRLEQFGSISRIKIHGSGSGDVTFRSDAAAQAAILASLEPGLGVSVGSCKVGFDFCFLFFFYDNCRMLIPSCLVTMPFLHDEGFQIPRDFLGNFQRERLINIFLGEFGV